MINDCLTAFKNKDYNEAVRLLPLAAEKAKKIQSVDDFSSRPLSKYTIYISSINPWYHGYLTAGLLHLSSRNGWLDITIKLIEQYQLHPREGDKEGNTSLHYAAAGNQLEIVTYFISFQRMSYKVSKNEYGATPLHIAAANGSLDVMKYLIEHHHWNTEDAGYRGRTVLHYGAKHIDTVKYLITECNCNPMVTDEYGKTVLHYAAEHIDTIKYLITECKCDPMVTDKNGKAVLHYAVQKKCSAVVEYFVSINPVDKNKNTFLHLAAKTSSYDVVKQLIGDYNSNPEAINRFGQRVLHCAVEHISIVKYLITECKCDPMITDKDGKTVLHYAAEHIDTIKYLITECKCDPMVTDKDGKTVLHYAAEHIDTIKYLITGCKCDPMVTDKDGKTALHYAAEHIDTIKYLITECKCDPMVTDKDGKTVLHYAVQIKCLAVVRYFASVNRVDKNKNTFLHLAAKTGLYDVVKQLIGDYNSNPEAINRFGQTVLHCAVEHISIVKYLITECKCDPMVTDKDGKTVLHYAAEHIDTIKYLITGCKCDPMVTDKTGKTVLYYAVKHIDIVKYLITECNCDPMVTDKDGKTVLHYAVKQNSLDAIEYLLSTGKCDPVAKDNKGRTPLQLTDGYNRQKVRTLFSKFGQVTTSHPVDSYVNVLLLGNPGAGKSTLSKVITDTATGSIAFGFRRNVKGVEPFTAGIIPYKLQHKTLGNIILHDFAGHSEYYSSHSAVIENLLQGSAGVFLIVVNILEKEAIKQLHQWLTVVRNEEQKALDQCHVIVVVSHKDEISDPAEKMKMEKIQEIIGRERCDSVFLDCRKLGGGGVDSLFNKLSNACESIRDTSGRNLSLYCHMMYGLLEEMKENILTLSDVMTAAKDSDSYVLPDKREEVLDVLHSLDSIGLIKVLKSEDKVWVVVNKGILLSELDGILFAPKTFKEHVDIASNTGIVSVSGLTRLFPDYDPDMLICFLKNMELCQEMNPSFLRMTNLHQLTVGKSKEEEEGETERRGERLLFFPCLLYSGRPDEMTSPVYQFGWCLQCTGKHHFFPPRYFHVLSLHLAYKLALPQEDDKLNRYCTFWKNGLCWFDGHGVGVLVEIVDESQCVLVLMSCEEGYNMVELRREVIGEVMSAYKESCPSLEVKELVIDPKELDYPVNTPRERTVYSAKAILTAIQRKQPFVVTNKKQTALKNILPDESTIASNDLSLLGGRDIKV